MKFKLWLESTEPLIVYHQTSMENAMRIKRSGRFSFKNAAQRIIWFTNNIQALKNNEIGAAGRGAILKLSVHMSNPAGWEEYNKLLLDQFRSYGYDGAILPEKDGTMNGFVFDTKQIKILGIVPLDEL